MTLRTNVLIEYLLLHITITLYLLHDSYGQFYKACYILQSKTDHLENCYLIWFEIPWRCQHCLLFSVQGYQVLSECILRWPSTNLFKLCFQMKYKNTTLFVSLKELALYSLFIQLPLLFLSKLWKIERYCNGLDIEFYKRTWFVQVFQCNFLIMVYII